MSPAGMRRPLDTSWRAKRRTEVRVGDGPRRAGGAASGRQCSNSELFSCASFGRAASIEGAYVVNGYTRTLTSGMRISQVDDDAIGTTVSTPAGVSITPSVKASPSH